MGLFSKQVKYLDDDENELLRLNCVRAIEWNDFYDHEFVLTNKSLIILRKKMEPAKFSLQDLKIKNGRADIIYYSSDTTNGPKLVLNFYSTKLALFFQGYDDAREWANEISILVSGQPANLPPEDEEAGRGGLLFKKKTQDKNDKMRAIKCMSCGASLVGYVGTVITCEYCETSMNV